MEIVLAIPASNDEKYNWSNSAGQGLKKLFLSFMKERILLDKEEQNWKL